MSAHRDRSRQFCTFANALQCVRRGIGDIPTGLPTSERQQFIARRDAWIERCAHALIKVRHAYRAPRTAARRGLSVIGERIAQLHAEIAERDTRWSETTVAAVHAPLTCMLADRAVRQRLC